MRQSMNNHVNDNNKMKMENHLPLHKIAIVHGIFGCEFRIGVRNSIDKETIWFFLSFSHSRAFFLFCVCMSSCVCFVFVAFGFVCLFLFVRYNCA